MNATRKHMIALGIVHAESGRTLSKGDFDLCMRIAKRALASDAASVRADISADRQFIAGVQLGWNFCDAGDEHGLRTCVEGRAARIRQASAEIRAAEEAISLAHPHTGAPS